MQIGERERKMKQTILQNLANDPLPATTVKEDALKGTPAQFYRLLAQHGALDDYVIFKQSSAAEILNVSKETVSRAARALMAQGILDFWYLLHKGRYVYAYKIADKSFLEDWHYLGCIFKNCGDITTLDIN